MAMDDDWLAGRLEALLDTAARESEEIAACARPGGPTDPLRARQEVDVLTAQVEALVAFARTRASSPPASLDAMTQAAAPRRVNPTGLRLVIPRVPAAPRSLAASIVLVALVISVVAAGWWAVQPSVPGSSPDVAALDLQPVTKAAVETPSPAGTLGTAGRAPDPSAPRDTAAPSVAEREIVAAAKEWLEAYFRQDQAGMAPLSAPGIRVWDERAAEERLPSGTSGVRRTVEGATVQHHGADAVLTARVIETAVDPATSGPVAFEAFVSQLWTKGPDGWHVHETRIVSAAAVSRAFRR